MAFCHPTSTPWHVLCQPPIATTGPAPCSREGMKRVPTGPISRSPWWLLVCARCVCRRPGQRWCCPPPRTPLDAFDLLPASLTRRNQMLLVYLSFHCPTAGTNWNPRQGLRSERASLDFAKASLAGEEQSHILPKCPKCPRVHPTSCKAALPSMGPPCTTDRSTSMNQAALASSLPFFNSLPGHRW